MRPAKWLLTALLSTTVTAASACSPAEPTVPHPFRDAVYDFLNNKRVHQRADCSFRNRRADDIGFGDPAIDLGDGRVLQMIGTFEHHWNAVVTDCATGESLTVDGKPEQDVCSIALLTEFIEPDVLDYRAGKTLKDFVRITERLGLQTTWDANWLNNGMKRKDQVNLNCGCQLFYPQSQSANK